jgi:hypothetical protein
MASFSPDVLQRIHRTDEIDIETTRRDGTLRRTTIWIMVVDDQVFIRSVRGPDGAWYKAVQRDPAVRVHADGQVLNTVASHVTDASVIARVSQAVSEKYQSRWPGPTAGMLRPETLGTTLRLDAA